MKRLKMRRSLRNHCCWLEMIGLVRLPKSRASQRQELEEEPGPELAEQLSAAVSEGLGFAVDSDAFVVEL